MVNTIMSMIGKDGGSADDGDDELRIIKQNIIVIAMKRASEPAS